MTTNYKNEWISPWHLFLRMHNAESSHRTFPHTVVYFSSLLAHFLKGMSLLLVNMQRRGFCSVTLSSFPTSFPLTFFPDEVLSLFLPPLQCVYVSGHVSAGTNTNVGGGPRLVFFLDHSILIFQNEIMI